MGWALEGADGVLGGKGKAAGVPEGVHCMTGGAPGASGRQQHAGNTFGCARARRVASIARRKLLLVIGLNCARGWCRCEPLHFAGTMERRIRLLDTMRRNAPDGSAIWS